MAQAGPVLRIFEVRTRPGCKAELLESFATTSVDVVRGEPGNRGYFFGEMVEGGGDVVMFVSLWRDLDAVKERFGEDWQVSFLPAGYEAMIEECSVRHLDAGAGWQVE